MPFENRLAPQAALAPLAGEGGGRRLGRQHVVAVEVVVGPAFLAVHLLDVVELLAAVLERQLALVARVLLQ